MRRSRGPPRLCGADPAWARESRGAAVCARCAGHHGAKRRRQAREAGRVIRSLPCACRELAAADGNEAAGRHMLDAMATSDSTFAVVSRLLT